MNSSRENHIEEVRKWLEEHVQVFDEPITVKLSNFEVNWTDFSGHFQLALDNITLKDKISFGLEASGKTTFYLPMFNSPLRAPASYAAIEITNQTSKAITAALHKTIPRLMGAGLHRKTKEEITYHTQPHERISQEELLQAMQTVSDSYKIEVEVCSV